jgi:type II secretory pathway component PulF
LVYIDVGYRELNWFWLLVTKQLSKSESNELIEQLALLLRSGMSLSDGLFAAAQEADSDRLSDYLRSVATKLTSGISLDQALCNEGRGFPKYVGGLIKAGIRTGNVGSVLIELVEQQQAYRDVWRRVLTALAYPCLLLVGTIGIAMVVVMGILPACRETLEQLDDWTDLPNLLTGAFETLVWISDRGIYFLIGFTVTALVATLLLAMLCGRAALSRVFSSLPAFGKLTLWQGFAEFARLLKILISQNVPLPEALALTAVGLRNSNVAAIANSLSIRTDQGQSLAEAMESNRHIPGIVVSMIHWGEQSADLVGALQTVHETLEGAIRLRAELLARVLPPLVFILIGSGLLAVLAGIFLPLANAANNLMFF